MPLLHIKYFGSIFGTDMVSRPSHAIETSLPDSTGRIDSWKQIAAYLGRHVRTVIFWEKKEKMPVHRHLHSKRGTIYAYKSELDAWRQNRTPRPRTATKGQLNSGKLMIAVLPFENLSGDASQECFCHGLTVEVISRLGRAQPERLGVIARTSSMQYKAKDKSIAQVGSELGVDYILEGSIRCCNGCVRVTSMLGKPADQVSVWSQDYDRKLADILMLQTDVATRIAKSVTESVTGQPSLHLICPRKTGGEAHDAYLKACHYSSENAEDSLFRAVHYFSRAVQMDPNLDIAYAGLANAYLSLAFCRVFPPHEIMPLAKTAALQALQINRDLAEAQAILAEIAFVYEWEWKEASERYQMAIDLNPKDRTVHHFYAFHLVAMGQCEKALREIRIAQSLNPSSALISAVAGDLLRYCGQYKEAVSEYIKALEIDYSYGMAHSGLGLAYEGIGKMKKALSEFELAARMSWTNSNALSALGHAQATSGNRAEALQTLKKLQMLSAKRYVPACDFALVYMGLDDENQALEFMDSAVQERSCELILLPFDQRAAPLKSNPRLKWALSSTGFPSIAL